MMLRLVVLVESGGAALPYQVGRTHSYMMTILICFQSEVFPDVGNFGRIFYNMSHLSAKVWREFFDEPASY